MIIKNFSGTSKSVFEIGLGSIKTFLGSITKNGKIQCQDNDGRTVRDLIQYSPRCKVVANYNQLATEFEIHNLVGAGTLTMEHSSTYTLDEGSVVII